MNINRDLLRDSLLRDIDRLPPGRVSDLFDRCTGRTTAIALRSISDAINSPGREHALEDHRNTTMAHENLADLCQSIVRKLGLEKFTINKPRRAIRCDFSEPL